MFETWYTRDYIDTLKWEDKIHTTPIYTRALKGLSELYFEIYEEQQQQQKSKADENDAVVVKRIVRSKEGQVPT